MLKIKDKETTPKSAVIKDEVTYMKPITHTAETREEQHYMARESRIPVQSPESKHLAIRNAISSKGSLQKLKETKVERIHLTRLGSQEILEKYYTIMKKRMNERKKKGKKEGRKKGRLPS